MKEVACAVCGAMYRFSAADIPPAGKTVSCAKCKARIVVPGEAAGGAGDVIDLADLPAPRRPAAPQVPGARVEASDLPAPKGPFPTGGPIARPSVAPSEIIDLPAPKSVPRPREPEPFTLDGVDLVAPVGPSRTVAPEAVRPAVTMPGLSDLPTPKRPAAARGGHELFDDLPAPRGPVADLPAPKRAAVPDLPAPKRPAAPPIPPLPPLVKSTVAGMPPPVPPAPPTAATGAPLPAPKGFFDDLPGPISDGRTLDLPAPKGFFDDLPSPAPAPRTPDLPAPKGFFHDVPAPRPSPPAQPAPPAISLFDDLPPPSIPRADRFVAPPAPSGTPTLDGIDLPSGNSGMIELEPTSAGARAGSMAPAPARHQPASEPPPALELGDDGLGLDLPVTAAQMSHGSSGGAGSVVSFKAGAQGAAEATRYTAAPTGDIDLAVERREPAAARTRAPAAVDKPAKPGKLSPRATRILLAAVLGVTAVGAGGFVMYRKWDAQKTRAADLDRNLQAARKAMMANERGHWRRATRAANDVLQLDKKHPEALGIAAEAALASLLEDGTDAESRTAVARRHLETASAAGARHATLDKARALRELVEGTPAEAVTTLTPLAARADTDASLFLGWAQAQAGDFPAAITAFTAALTARPVPATYGLAQAQAGSGDTAAAHATFLKVIALDPEHVGALVGEVLTAPASDLGKREASLLAILQRKDIDQADPRAVVLAWTRAGDEARRGGRLDAARDRYRKALAILPRDRGVLVSLAATELIDGNLDAATQAVDQALALAPDDVEANLTRAEIDLRQGKASDTATRLSALREHKPPITAPALLSRLDMIDGQRLELEKNPAAALAAYERAATAIAGADVGPTIAAAMLLGRMAVAADAAGKVPEAAALRVRADAKLVQIAAAAEQDASLAITLGVAYLAAGAPAPAERWLRSAIEKRPTEVEAHYQLAEALRRQGKQDEAVATLVKAFELDPTRLDLGVELARGFEAARRDADAAELYKKLLALKDVTVETRVRAGRFFARTKDIATARRLGDELLAVTPDDATGRFLKAEGLIDDKRFSEARRLLQDATSTNPDAQFLDALGRASEKLSEQTGDTAIRDEALRSYEQASKLDKDLVNAWAGAGRLRLLRGEYEKALDAFEEALKLTPSDPELPYGIGAAYAALEDRGRAIEWLSRAVAAKPRADAYYQLGTLYYEADRAGAAASALERATALATKDERDGGVTVPWLTEALWLLGTVQQVQRNDGATIRAWEAYLARKPPSSAQTEEVRRFLLSRGR